MLHISPLYIANIKELSNVTGGLILFLWKIYVKTLNLTWYFLSICIVVLYVWFRFLWFLLTGTWIWAQDLGGYRQFYKVHIRYNKLHYLGTYKIQNSCQLTDAWIRIEVLEGKYFSYASLKSVLKNCIFFCIIITIAMYVIFGKYTVIYNQKKSWSEKEHIEENHN